MKTALSSTIIVVLALAVSGCVVVKPVVGAGTAVAGAAVKTTAKVAGTAADAAIPDKDKKSKTATEP